MYLKKLFLFVAFVCFPFATKAWDFGDRALVYYQEEQGKVIVVTADGVKTVDAKKFPLFIFRDQSFIFDKSGASATVTTQVAAPSDQLYEAVNQSTYFKYVEFHNFTPDCSEFDVVEPLSKKIIWTVSFQNDLHFCDIVNRPEGICCQTIVGAPEFSICRNLEECKTACKCGSGHLIVWWEPPLTWSQTLRLYLAAILFKVDTLILGNQ